MINFLNELGLWSFILVTVAMAFITCVLIKVVGELYAFMRERRRQADFKGALTKNQTDEEYVRLSKMSPRELIEDSKKLLEEMKKMLEDAKRGKDV